jgi:hypothetical protein
LTPFYRQELRFKTCLRFLTSALLYLFSIEKGQGQGAASVPGSVLDLPRTVRITNFRDQGTQVVAPCWQGEARVVTG